MRLCVSTPETVDSKTGDVKPTFDTSITSELFRDFGDRAINGYRFGDVELLEQLDLQRDVLAVKINKARESRDPSVDIRKLEAERRQAEKDILAVRQQVPTANEIVENHIAELEYWLTSNEVELVKHFSTAARLDGFDRDGKTEIAWQRMSPVLENKLRPSRKTGRSNSMDGLRKSKPFMIHSNHKSTAWLWQVNRTNRIKRFTVRSTARIVT